MSKTKCQVLPASNTASFFHFKEKAGWRASSSVAQRPSVRITPLSSTTQ